MNASHSHAPLRRPALLYRLSAVTIILAMLLGACQPTQIVPPATAPVQGPTGAAPAKTAAVAEKTKPAPTATPQNLIPVVDKGEPLPPQLIAQDPPGGRQLSLSGAISLTFDQPMDTAATTTAWKLVDDSGVTVPGIVSWPTERTLAFKPKQPLKVSKVYQLTLDKSAKSARGVALTDPLSLQFETITPLAISQVFPANGTQDVASNAAITVIFNRAVVPLGVREDASKLPNPLVISPTLAGKGEWVNTSVYAFRPEKRLQSGVTYQVTVKAGLADAGQETALEQDYAWGFTVAAPRLNSLELPNGESNPGDYAKQVLLDTYFAYNFAQPMQPDATAAAISLQSDNGEKVPVNAVWSQDFTRVVFTPTQRLAIATDYTLQLQPTAVTPDGAALTTAMPWHFRTVPLPSVVSTEPANGSSATYFEGYLRIQFASPMALKTITDHIEITPAPDKAPNWWYDSYGFSVGAYFLKPSTSYTVRLLPGMQDIYGNAITKETVVRFKTGQLMPSAYLSMPYGPAVLFRSGGPMDFYASYVNVGKVSLALYKVDAKNFAGMLRDYDLRRRFNPPDTDLIWRADEQGQAALNKQVLKDFKLETASGAPVAPGFYFLTLTAEKVTRETGARFNDMRPVVVANGNLSFKTDNTEALVWLTDLTSGQPLSNVPVTIYDQNFNAIGKGTTDPNGLFQASGLPVPPEPYDKRLAVAGEAGGQVFAFASSDFGSGASTSDYGIWSSFYGPTNQPRAYVYTDRPLYRPGQPVYFKGIVRLDDDLKYSLPKDAQVHVKVTNYKGLVWEADLPLSEFGSFNSQLDLSSDAVLGYYSVDVSLPLPAAKATPTPAAGQPRKGDQTPQAPVIGSVSFNVSEYRKPEFQVTVTSDVKNVLAGDKFAATVKAEYYSGGVVANAAVEWTLRSDPFYFNPPSAFSGYSFNDYELDAGLVENTQPGTDILAQGKGQTDEDGQFNLSLPADLSKYKTSRQLTFEATVTDVSQSAVSGRVEVVAHRSQVYPGVKPQSYVGRAKTEQAFDVVALDWDGKPVAGQKVNVEIVERRWSSVQEQLPDGRVEWKSSVEDVPVTSFTDVALDASGKATVKFTPPNGGVFRAKVTARDGRGNEAAASTYLWVAGDDFIPWRQSNDRSFDLVADRATYTPGDTAEILIASPFEGPAYALVTVERGHVRRAEVVQLTSNSTVYKLPITPEMAPNVYVSVLVVKGVDDKNPRPNFKMGITELKVDRTQQSLAVEVVPDKTQAGPGDTVNYTVRVKDAQGQPVSAEVSLGLTDLATLSLASPNSGPLLDFFYARRSLGVWTSVPIELNVEDYNAEIAAQLQAAQGAAMGSGGGGEKGEGDWGVIAVRQNFPDTPFWQADLTTNAQGEASVSVTLPDNLTTWRMDARAVTADTRVGQVTQDIISSRPLLVRPQTPRFFVASDVARVGAGVNNNTDQSLTVQVRLDAEGVSIDGDAAQTVEVPAKRQAYVSWQVTVNPDAARVDLVFTAQSGSYSDASRPPAGTLDNQGLPVYRFEAFETVGTSGQVSTAGSQLEAINLPVSTTQPAGSLTIKLAPSLAAGMTDALTYLEHYPYECTEQTVSRFLPNVLSAKALKAAGLSDPTLEQNLQAQVNIALQRLYNGQKADGGWSWWPESEKSDPTTSAYVVLSLVEAKDAGYPVDDRALSNGVTYLKGSLLSFDRPADDYLLNRQALMLFVLARASQPDVSRSVQLFDQRLNMALYARALLAHAFFLADKTDARIQTLLSDFTTAGIVSATGTHWEEKTQDWWNWNTDTRTTAIVLSALAEIDPKNPLNANAVRWLMANRNDGHWQGTQETAWSLMALTSWMTASGELQANYNFAAAVNGERIGGGEANAETLRQVTELTVDVAKLMKDQANRLVIARDGDGGVLYYTAHLNVNLPVESVKALDAGLTVTRSYYRSDDPNTPVTEAKVGDMLLARLTVVVPSAMHYLMVADPLPAGLEAVDQSLLTSVQNVTPPQQQFTWEDMWRYGWGWWSFDHIQMKDNQVLLSAQYLPAGTYVYTYFVRAGTAGSFRAIPPTAQEFYFPEVYGRGDGMLFTVNP